MVTDSMSADTKISCQTLICSASTGASEQRSHVADSMIFLERRLHLLWMRPCSSNQIKNGPWVAGGIVVLDEALDMPINLDETVSMNLDVSLSYWASLSLEN
jgi:hypothetical protein